VENFAAQFGFGESVFSVACFRASEYTLIIELDLGVADGACELAVLFFQLDGQKNFVLELGLPGADKCLVGIGGVESCDGLDQQTRQEDSQQSLMERALRVAMHGMFSTKMLHLWIVMQ
jgi:hypothetical protein